MRPAIGATGRAPVVEPVFRVDRELFLALRLGVERGDLLLFGFDDRLEICGAFFESRHLSAGLFILAVRSLRAFEFRRRLARGLASTACCAS